MREHFRGLAADDERAHAAAAMQGHADQIAASLFGGIDDRPKGMLMLDLKHGAGHATRLGVALDFGKVMTDLFTGMTFHRRGAPRGLRRLGSPQLDRLDHRHGRNLGAGIARHQCQFQRRPRTEASRLSEARYAGTCQSIACAARML
jgi:hypothetical protein